MSDYEIARIFVKIANKIWESLPEKNKKKILDRGLIKEKFIYDYVQKAIHIVKSENIFSDEEMKEIAAISDDELEKILSNNINSGKLSITIIDTITNESNVFQLKA